MRDAQRAAIVVRAGRAARGLSRKELAAATASVEEDRLPYSTIANFENGQRRLTAEISTRLAQAMSITDDQLLDGLAAATHSIRLWEAGETEWCFPVRKWVEVVFSSGADRVRLVEASITHLLKPAVLLVEPDTSASRKLGEMLESFREAAGMTIDQLAASSTSTFRVADYEAAELGNFGSNPSALTVEFLTAVGVPVAAVDQLAPTDSGIDVMFIDPQRNVRVALEFKTQRPRQVDRPSVAPAPPHTPTFNLRTREELIGMIVARLVQAPIEVIAQVAEQVGIEAGP